MLIIRDLQMEALSTARWKDFAPRAVSYLTETAPEWCAELGAARVNELVQTAIRKARHYKLVEEFDVLRYLNAVCLLGDHFDSDLPWALDILGKSSISARLRMDALSEQLIALEEPPETAEPEEGDEEADEDVEPEPETTE